MRTYKVYRKDVANRLCHRGFKVVKLDYNDQKPWLYMYIFEDTPDFRLALEEEINILRSLPGSLETEDNDGK